MVRHTEGTQENGCIKQTEDAANAVVTTTNTDSPMTTTVTVEKETKNQAKIIVRFKKKQKAEKKYQNMTLWKLKENVCFEK